MAALRTGGTARGSRSGSRSALYYFSSQTCAGGFEQMNKKRANYLLIICVLLVGGIVFMFAPIWFQLFASGFFCGYLVGDRKLSQPISN